MSSNTLRDELYPILNRAADVPLGGDLVPLADRILSAVHKALLAPAVTEAVGEEFTLRWGELDEYDINPRCRETWNVTGRVVLARALDAAGLKGTDDAHDR